MEGTRSFGIALKSGPVIPEFAITTFTKPTSVLTFSARAARLSFEVMSPRNGIMDLLS